VGSEIPYVTVEGGERLFLDFHAVGRHPCLTHAARAGVPLSVVQKLARQASPVTTARYVQHIGPGTSRCRSADARSHRACLHLACTAAVQIRATRVNR
jgi:hypothetical protein